MELYVILKYLDLFTKNDHYNTLLTPPILISAREKYAVCDVTNLSYVDINLQSISI